MYDYIPRIIDMATCTKSVDRRWLHSTESKIKITISLDVQRWVYGWGWEGSGG